MPDPGSSTPPPQYNYPGGTLQGDRIRVLNLLSCSPTDSDQRLKCEIETVCHSSHPIYSAVSYTWGTLANSADLWIDDAVIDITTNLFELLCRFRRADEKVVLWVDAICINQKNKDEMTVQIPLMADIYSSASEVLIWLGEGDHQSDAVMRFLREVGQKFIQRGGDIKEPRDDIKNRDVWDRVQNDLALEHVRVIWDRPWFTRRWVVQELAFAKVATVICGAQSMAWEELAYANIAMGRLATDGSFHHRWFTDKGRPFTFDSGGGGRIDTLRRIRDEMQSRQLAGRSRSNVACVAEAWGFECSVEKDRVCALLGVFNHGRHEPFKVDYAESTETIYEKFALHCVQTGDPKDVLDILSYAGLSKRYALAGPHSLPSWVPDWRIRFDGPAHLLYGFIAGHKVGASMEMRSDERELLVRGLLIDRVQCVVNSSSSFAPFDDASKCSLLSPGYQAQWYKAIEALFTQCFGPYRFEMPHGVVGAPYALGGSAWEALFKTLILDDRDVVFDAKRDLPMLRRSGDDGEQFPLWEEGTAFRKRMLTALDNEPSEDVDESNAIQIVTHEEREYYTRASMNTEYRSFYITQRGLMGLGPKEMESGDIIGLPFGASVPYVLRPVEKDLAMLWDAQKTVEIERKGYFQMPDGGLKLLILRAKKPRYELVGECYAHGIMRGEAWAVDFFFAEEFVLC